MSKQRWMKWIDEDAATQEVIMPWERPAKGAAKMLDLDETANAKSA